MKMLKTAILLFTLFQISFASGLENNINGGGIGKIV